MWPDAVCRLLEHHVHSAYAAERVLDPVRDPLTLHAPVAGVTVTQPHGNDEAMSWFTAEQAALLAAVDHAPRAGFHLHAYHLAWALSTYLDRRGLWSEWAAVWEIALAAAQHVADPTARLNSYRFLATANIRLHRFDQATTLLNQAADLCRESGDVAGEAHCHFTLGMTAMRQADDTGSPDRYGEALDHTARALDLYRRAAHRRGEALALNAIGWSHAHLGNHAQALTNCEEALVAFQEMGDQASTAEVLDSLGYVHHRRRDHEQATEYYHRAVALHRANGDMFQVARTLANLGDSHRAAGRTAAARDAWLRAGDIYADLKHPWAETVRAKVCRLDGVDPVGGAGPSGADQLGDGEWDRNPGSG